MELVILIRFIHAEITNLHFFWVVCSNTTFPWALPLLMCQFSELQDFPRLNTLYYSKNICIRVSLVTLFAPHSANKAWDSFLGADCPHLYLHPTP